MTNPKISRRPITPIHEGDRFGRLLIEGYHYRVRSDGRRRAVYDVLCDCGERREVWAQNLLSGDTRSCGCLHRERASVANTTHGGSKTTSLLHGRPGKEGIPRQPRLYALWKNMRERCTNERAANYRWYGAKGITVDPAWDDFAVFREWALAIPTICN